MKTFQTLAGAIFVSGLLLACNQTPANANTPEIKAMVTQKAQQHGIPPDFAHGIVKVESDYRCHAKNPNSTATGLMQVIRGTAREVGVHGNLKDCATGLEAGMRYLKQALRRAGGKWCHAATLYYLGIYATPRPSAYCRKVMASAGAGRKT